MLTGTQEQILASLVSHPEEQPTIRGIAKRLGKSYTLVYNNISDLEKKGIIVKHDVPPAQIITLNEFAPDSVVVHIELKRKYEFLKRHPWIEVMLQDILSSAGHPFFILLVFGSYAKEEMTAKSDLDLLFVLPDKKSTADMEKAAEKAFTKVKKGVTVVGMDDFTEMISNPNRLNVGNEARKHHIILYGIEAYHQLITGALAK